MRLVQSKQIEFKSRWSIQEYNCRFLLRFKKKIWRVRVWKMEPLATNRQVLIWLYMCPADESASRWQKIAHTISAMFALLGLICVFIACTAFIWKYVSIDVGRCIFAIMFLAAESTATYMALVGMVSMRQKIGRIFDDLSTIYKDSKCSSGINLN